MRRRAYPKRVSLDPQKGRLGCTPERQQKLALSCIGDRGGERPHLTGVFVGRNPPVRGVMVGLQPDPLDALDALGFPRRTPVEARSRASHPGGLVEWAWVPERLARRDSTRHDRDVGKSTDGSGNTLDDGRQVTVALTARLTGFYSPRRFFFQRLRLYFRSCIVRQCTVTRIYFS